MKNHAQIVAGKLVSDTFLKKLKFHIVCFYLYVHIEDYENIMNKGTDNFLLLQTKLKITEKGLGLVSLPHFCMIFEEEYFSRYVLLTYEISLADDLYFLRYLTICLL